MFCGREGNRRCGVALAMRLRLKDVREMGGQSTQATFLTGHDTLYLYVLCAETNGVPHGHSAVDGPLNSTYCTRQQS